MIFFDIDGTLLDHKCAEYLGIQNFYNEYRNYFTKMSMDEFYSLWCQLADKYFERYLLKKCSFEEQRVYRIKELFAIVHIELSYKNALDKFSQYLINYELNWKPFDDVLSCINKLSNYQLGIISNGDYNQQLMKLNKMGVSQYFSDIITAGEFGVAKPDTKLFEIACTKNNVRPEKCYYIGDVIKTDIIPCKKIGMHGIWINRTSQIIFDKNIKTILSLDELDQVIQRF